MEFHLFLPQLRLSFERLVASARAAEAAGFRGIAGMDHLVPPGAEGQPLGLGWGSWDGEFSKFGVGPAEPAARVRRMRETLEVLRVLWAGETVERPGHPVAQARAG